MSGQVEVVIKSRKPWAPGYQSGVAKGRSWRSLETAASERQDVNTTGER